MTLMDTIVSLFAGRSLTLRELVEKHEPPFIVVCDTNDFLTVKETIIANFYGTEYTHTDWGYYFYKNIG